MKNAVQAISAFGHTLEDFSRAMCEATDKFTSLHTSPPVPGRWYHKIPVIGPKMHVVEIRQWLMENTYETPIRDIDGKVQGYVRCFKVEADI
jgi:hypothetical protein